MTTLNLGDRVRSRNSSSPGMVIAIYPPTSGEGPAVAATVFVEVAWAATGVSTWGSDELILTERSNWLRVGARVDWADHRGGGEVIEVKAHLSPGSIGIYAPRYTVRWPNGDRTTGLQRNELREAAPIFARGTRVNLLADYTSASAPLELPRGWVTEVMGTQAAVSWDDRPLEAQILPVDLLFAIPDAGQMPAPWVLGDSVRYSNATPAFAIHPERQGVIIRLDPAQAQVRWEDGQRSVIPYLHLERLREADPLRVGTAVRYNEAALNAESGRSPARIGVVMNIRGATAEVRWENMRLVPCALRHLEAAPDLPTTQLPIGELVGFSDLQLRRMEHATNGNRRAIVLRHVDEHIVRIRWTDTGSAAELLRAQLEVRPSTAPQFKRGMRVRYTANPAAANLAGLVRVGAVGVVMQEAQGQMIGVSWSGGTTLILVDASALEILPGDWLAPGAQVQNLAGRIGSIRAVETPQTYLVRWEGSTFYSEVPASEVRIVFPPEMVPGAAITAGDLVGRILRPVPHCGAFEIVPDTPDAIRLAMPCDMRVLRPPQLTVFAEGMPVMAPGLPALAGALGTVLSVEDRLGMPFVAVRWQAGVVSNTLPAWQLVITPPEERKPLSLVEADGLGLEMLATVQLNDYGRAAERRPEGRKGRLRLMESRHGNAYATVEWDDGAVLQISCHRLEALDPGADPDRLLQPGVQVIPAATSASDAALFKGVILTRTEYADGARVEVRWAGSVQTCHVRELTPVLSPKGDVIMTREQERRAQRNRQQERDFARQKRQGAAS